ncbi:HAD family hydrolase [Caldifermentibacillus hisashii]|uniref:HAD family hydrolase n=1 Tax=Caldifermentibacillus hisashii TaxID=996558 RepID=UPI0034D43754
MFRGVIFDMDGVLVNTEKFYFDRRMEFLATKSIEPFSRNIKDYVGLTNHGIWESMFPDNPALRNHLKSEYDEYRLNHPLPYAEVLNEGVKETLEELKKRNIKIAIASSSEKKEIDRMIKECDLDSLVDYYISGEDCQNSKPDPEIYKKAIEVLEMNPEECIAIEDSSVGIESAKQAGLYVLALKQKDYKVDQSSADETITRIKDVLIKL